MPSSLPPHRINHSEPTTSAGNCHMQYQPSTSITNNVIPISSLSIPEHISHQHTYTITQNQCCSAVVQHIKAPLSTVWSIVRKFDTPQTYKHFLKSCNVVYGDGCSVGTVREVHVVSGMPAASSLERLEILDDEQHVLSFSMVGGDHRLQNYRSVTTLHSLNDVDEEDSTVVIEAYVVDVPAGNTREETCVFVETIVRCNLQSLAHKAENIAKNDKKSS